MWQAQVWVKFITKSTSLNYPDKPEYFFLRNKAYHSLYLGTSRKSTTHLIMAKKTTYETNHRLHWQYRNGNIINRNNSMMLMVHGDVEVILGFEPEKEDSFFKFVDGFHYDDYEEIESQKTKKVLEPSGGQGSNVTMKLPYKRGKVNKKQIWLREPVLGNK